MATNSIKTRIINKHDIEANWNLATNFTPNEGELIIYDKGTGYNYPRLKIGDGSTKVGLLPFIDEKLKKDIEDISKNIVSITGQVTKINEDYTTLSTTQTISGAKTFTGGIVANSTISGSGIINNTTIGSLGWNSSGATNTNNLRLININTLAYWDGSYDGTTSNLTRLGTIKTGTWNGTKIAIGYGGTGTSTAPIQGGIIYGASTSAYGCTAAGTSGYVLKSNGTSAPSWIAQSSIAAGSATKDGSGNTITSYYLPKANVSGTANYVPKFTAANSVGNSRITDDGTTIVLGGNTSINGSSGDTGLYVKSTSTGSYIGIINSSNTTLGFFGYSSANVPVVYYSSAAHRIINAADGTGTVGSSTKPMYASGGVATACSYELNVANSTNTSSKIFLIGATAQGSNQTTYSHDTTYVDTSASLHSTSFTIATKAKLNYNTTDNCIEFTFA